MVTREYPRPAESLESSWYEIIAEQLRALIPRFGLTQSSEQLYRAYELICSQSLGKDPAQAVSQSSRLNHDGTPIQFALGLGRQPVSLQFLSETGKPNLSDAETGKFIEQTVRILSESLQLNGDLDSIVALIRRASAVSAHDVDPDHGGTFWIGAGFAPGGKSGLKIYINGKEGTENTRWSKLEDFASFFGASEKYRKIRQWLAGKMTPLGMAVSLNQGESPGGRIYLTGYGNPVSYYEDLLRHFGDQQYVDAFRQFTEVMLEDDRHYPTQSAVFSAGFSPDPDAPTDVKIEFCGHCLFQGDSQARYRCLRWLALRNIDAHAYTDMLDVIAGQISPTNVNTHVYVGVGWKNHAEYTTIYLKPNRPYPSPCDAM